MLAVVAVLILLLPLLAWLQYDWLGKVSEREGEQMQASLRRNLAQFRDDFDREIARIFLQFSQTDQTDHPNDEYAKVLAHWNKSAPYPKLIRDVFIDSPSSATVLEHLNPLTGKWEAADWVTEFGPRRQLLEPVDGRIPALVIPVGSVTKLAWQTSGIMLTHDPRRLIVRLDLNYIQKEFLPSLIHAHFSEANADYKLNIRDREDPSRVFYSSDGSTLQGDGDADEGILGLRLHEFRGLAPAAIELEEGEFDKHELDKKVRVEHAVALNVVHASGDSPMTGFVTAKAVVDLESDAWKIMAVHRSGSLDAAVAQLRRRNLAVSFGILTLLGAGIGIVLVSASRAQQLARQQMEFVSAVSHELRTPLAVICAAGENIADGVVREPEQFRSYGKLVRNEGRRLSEMVEQVLSFAGIQSGLKKYTLVPTAVSPMIDRALSVFEGQLHDQGFTLERHIAEDVPQVMADAPSLTRAFQNLISNAIKYSGPGRWIVIAAVNEGGFVKVSVRDSGPGIATEDLPHIYEPFYRGRAAVDAQIQGSGLGLNLVRQTVEAHGGEITVTSNPGCGTTFCISLAIA